MEDVTKAGETPSAATQGVDAPAPAQRTKVRHVLGVLKRHPLGLVAALGAAAALVEIELAVGVLAGIGATALLVTKSGPEARHEVVAKGQEVVAKSKAAIERARVALASRAKTQPEASAPAEQAPAPEPQAPAA